MWLHVQGRQRAEQLNILLQRFMLRRTKAIISGLLPKKQDHIVFCQLSELQLRAYKFVACPCSALLLTTCSLSAILSYQLISVISFAVFSDIS